MARTFLLTVLVEAVFLIVGVACLFWPQRIQDFALSHEGLLLYNPFKSWMRTRYYLWSLRAAGLLAILCGWFVAMSIYKQIIEK